MGNFGPGLFALLLLCGQHNQEPIQSWRQQPDCCSGQQVVSTKEMLAPFAVSFPEQHKKLLKCHNGSQMKNGSKRENQIFPVSGLNELLRSLYAPLKM